MHAKEEARCILQANCKRIIVERLSSATAAVRAVLRPRRASPGLEKVALLCLSEPPRSPGRPSPSGRFQNLVFVNARQLDSRLHFRGQAARRMSLHNADEGSPLQTQHCPCDSEKARLTEQLQERSTPGSALQASDDKAGQWDNACIPGPGPVPAGPGRCWCLQGGCRHTQP